MRILILFVILFITSCQTDHNRSCDFETDLPPYLINYQGTPLTPYDRSPFAFSDQGAWFAYGFNKEHEYSGGFSGPFLMTQENGVWCSKALSYLTITDAVANTPIHLNTYPVKRTAYNSHLEQVFQSDSLVIRQRLFYFSPHTAVHITEIFNASDQKMILRPAWKGELFLEGLNFKNSQNSITIVSDKSNAVGTISLPDKDIPRITLSDTNYTISLKEFELKARERKLLVLVQSFFFPEYDQQQQLNNIRLLFDNPYKHLGLRIKEKEYQINKLSQLLGAEWQDSCYRNLLAKSVLTLQNNWRIPAGELKHSGLFPSYHYIWFHGFWAWDSWKHATALAYFNPQLAREQIMAMYDFQDEDGLIADCIYRDTTIENHNYRNTKPPLSAWAAWIVYKKDNDHDFLTELYPKILKQHYWWYKFRDHDRDGLCEYGSTDGSLIAAKWESGMDNAVRFDNSQILKNNENAYSLNQESVDLNAYLYAEKVYLIEIAGSLREDDEAERLSAEAKVLKKKIREQFFEPETGWFYDTSLDGETFVEVMGCEGWIPLWAGIASPKEAEAVKNNMMDADHFNVIVPLQTLSADHPKFQPDGGYWRGPVWLDQAYFGIMGLKKYGYEIEADHLTYKLIHNAEGVLTDGKSIRENYHPLTGAGLESENFSWSAAHYLLLLINE